MKSGNALQIEFSAPVLGLFPTIAAPAIGPATPAAA
jgi:hypothetical protein